MPSSILLISNDTYESLLYSSHAWLYVYLLCAYISAECGALLSSLLLLCVCCWLCPSSLILIPFIVKLCSDRNRGWWSTAIGLLLTSSLVVIHAYTYFQRRDQHSNELLHAYDQWKSVQGLIADGILEINRYRSHLLRYLCSYHGIVSSNHYLPGTGIRWYLQAQMLPAFQGYFDVLLSCQPLICGLCVYFHISINDPSLAVHLVTVVFILFMRDQRILDVLLAMAVLLFFQSKIVCRMRYLSLITAGILVPLLVSPAMTQLWLQYGTGNANYCFFQGLCQWLFCAFGINEFLLSYFKQLRDAEGARPV